MRSYGGRGGTGARGSTTVGRGGATVGRGGAQISAGSKPVSMHVAAPAMEASNKRATEGNGGWGRQDPLPVTKSAFLVDPTPTVAPKVELKTASEPSYYGTRNISVDRLQPRMRFHHLMESFPRDPMFVLQCCANDGAGLSLEETVQLYQSKFKPKQRELIQDRAKLVRELTLAYSFEQLDIEGKSAAVRHAWQQLQPGLLICKQGLSIAAQQRFAELSFAIGNPPRPDMSGGWYSFLSNAMALNNEHYGQMLDKIQAFPPQYKQMCESFLDSARAFSTSSAPSSASASSSSCLPAMSPTVVLLNFYTDQSAGLYWHRDNSVQERRSAKQGSPVVSVSIGDSCDFEYKMNEDDPVQSVRLESGDVLIFGGPSRMIMHSVTKIYPNTSPITMPRPGRINVTYRCWD